MTIRIDHKPLSRGVTQLMYVGDDDAVEHATDRSVLIAGACSAVALLTGQGLKGAAIAGGISYALARLLR